MSIIFPFRSRYQTMRFSTALSKLGFSATVISTPRALSLGCGLSVATSQNALEIARSLIFSLSLNTCIGAFRINSNSSDIGYERIF